MSVVDSIIEGRRIAELRIRARRTKRFLRELLKNPLTSLGFLLVIGFFLMALLAPEIAPPQGNNPYQLVRDWGASNAPPLTPGHPFGTTDRGGDVFYGIVWGSRLAIAISVGVVSVIAVKGIILGAVAGHYGGWVDDAIMRVVDVMIAIPGIVWAIAVLSALGPSYFNIWLAIITLFGGGYARIVRGEVVHVKNEEYVDAARLSGRSELSVIFKDVLPNAVPPLLVSASLDMGRIVLLAASLSFIGLAESGLASWGRLIALGQSQLLAGRWWTSIIPGVFIFLWGFAWNMIGDGLRDVIDPRSREH